MINRKIYCVWVGENTAMNENRINGLESIRKNSGVEVVLVNNDNLNSLIKVS